jgi:PEP-CTERM motif
MTRITSFVVCIGLLSLGAAPRASAEPIIITGGTFLVPGLSEAGSISIVGTRGFSLVSKVTTLEGRVDPFTNCFPCSPGVSTISIGAFQAGTSFYGPVTLDGVTYHVGDGIDDPELIGFEIFGTAPVPGVDSLPTSVTVPFTLEGNFFASFPEAGVPIKGRGLATLFFRPDASMPVNPNIERVRYDFTDQTPVPEPSTLTMVAGGLLAVVRAARKRRQQTRGLVG